MTAKMWRSHSTLSPVPGGSPAMQPLAETGRKTCRQRDATLLLTFIYALGAEQRLANPHVKTEKSVQQLEKLLEKHRHSSNRMQRLRASCQPCSETGPTLW